MPTRRRTVPAAAAIFLAACAPTVSGRPQSGDALPIEITEPRTTNTPWPSMPTVSTSSGAGRTYTTISPTGSELPAHQDSHYACDLLSWDALDPRVRPKDTSTLYPWPVTPSRTGSMECRIVNEDIKTKVVMASVVVWRNMEMLPEKTADVEGNPATISERKPYQCTIIADVDLKEGRGHTKVGFVVTNERFIEPGLEPCTLTRQVATWTLRR